MTDKIKELETKLEEIKVEIEKLKDVETYHPISGRMVYDPDFNYVPIKVLSVERYKPEKGEKYNYISDWGKISSSEWVGDKVDEYRYNTNNAVSLDNRKTLEDKMEKDLIRQQLEDIALNLNKGAEIDWNSWKQDKYYIYYNHEACLVEMCSENIYETCGTIYCLSKKFLDVALEEIGEEKLKFLMGVEE